MESASVFERELAAYKRDPIEYKARNAPGVVVKLMELDRQHRQQEREEAREASRKADLSKLSTEEIEYRLMTALGIFKPLP